MYNWYAVNTGKLCPVGWHVPSLIELQVLINYLGGPQIAGGRMKEAGTAHWRDPNKDGSNSSGFNGLPGGIREEQDSQINITGWWYINEATSQNAITYRLEELFSSCGIMGIKKSNGCSVRCIKDN